MTSKNYVSLTSPTCLAPLRLKITSLEQKNKTLRPLTANPIECYLWRSFCPTHWRCRVAPCRAIVTRTVHFHYLLVYFHSRVDLLHCSFDLSVSLSWKGADTISIHYTQFLGNHLPNYFLRWHFSLYPNGVYDRWQ